MRVRYIADRFPRHSADGGGGDHLRDGAEYEVFEVDTVPERRTWFRVERMDGTPALFDARCFVLVDDNVPADWRVTLADDGWMTLAPDAFLRAGFWERFFDGDAGAEEEYARVVGHPRAWR